ncbi:MAG: nitroreductase [Tenuifilaceae bacterium]
MTTLLLGQLNLNAQDQDLLKMVQYATMAPSGHNTQPWIFTILESSIEIRPDFSNSLPIVDSNNRELYISLGCATENLCITANELGYETNYSVELDSNNHHFIRVKISKGNPSKNYLFGEIEKRQTNRSEYTNRIIMPSTIKELKRLSESEGVKVRFYENDSNDFLILKDHVAQGNAVQMKDAAFKKELLSWIRFNKKEVTKQQNGLTYEVMGTPATPTFLGRLIVKSFLKPNKQNKGDMKKISSSSHLVLFTIEQNNPENWILLGRILERFLLETTRLGIACAYLNQPCEVEAIAKSMQSKLQINNEFPAILLRIGYSNPLPYSPRKELDRVVRFK